MDSILFSRAHFNIVLLVTLNLVAVSSAVSNSLSDIHVVLHMYPQELLLLRCGHLRPPCAPPDLLEEKAAGPLSGHTCKHEVPTDAHLTRADHDVVTLWVAK